MIGMGSRPVSAIRPANTETNAGGPPASVATVRSTCATVISAVTLSFTPVAGKALLQLGASSRPACW